MGEYNPEDYEQEVEQIVQLEQEQDQDAQLEYEVEQDPHQDVQLAQEVEQEVAEDIQEGHPIQAAQPVFGGLENIPQQQIGVVEGIAEGMVVVEEMPDIYGEQENVNPNIMGAPIQFVGIPAHEGVAIGVLQEQVVNIQEPQQILPPQDQDEIAPIDNDNGGLEVEDVEEFEIQVVEVDGDGDVVMADINEGEGVDEGVGQGIRDTRARREFREREQERRDRAGDGGNRGRRVRRRFR
eukprot:g5426.t1